MRARFVPPGSDEEAGGFVARMPGKVIELRVAVGDRVAAGDTLLVLEAMKMEHPMRAVEDGTCLLDWDYSQGEPPAPLLKDLFGSERRRAKTLNFSIAYGKTAHGLSKDWGVSIDEAKEMLRAWYADRPEVLQWQKDTIASARATGRSSSRWLLGRTLGSRTRPGFSPRTRASAFPRTGPARACPPTEPSSPRA